MQTDLDDQVRAALVARKGEWPRIAVDCQVSHSWISQFVRNKIENPGFLTLKRLHGYLTPPGQTSDAPPAAADEAVTQAAA